MDFSFSSLMAGFVFGVFGFWFLKEGKRKEEWRILFIGAGLIIYPYFITNDFILWGLGAILCYFGYKFWRLS